MKKSLKKNNRENLIKRTLVIVPCYNMNFFIKDTINDLKKYFKNILIIDDCSDLKVSNLDLPKEIDQDLV